MLRIAHEMSENRTPMNANTIEKDRSAVPVVVERKVVHSHLDSVFLNSPLGTGTDDRIDSVRAARVMPPSSASGERIILWSITL